MEKINFILTGGTIDSRYDSDKCTVVPLIHSVIPNYLLRTIGMEEKFLFFTEICMKDSRDLTETDLSLIIAAIKKSPFKKLIVTVGTFSLFDIACYLESRLGQKETKSVVLTGSMIPLQGFIPSDAAFNLGFSISRVLSMTGGVSVCIRGNSYLPMDDPKLHG